MSFETRFGASGIDPRAPLGSFKFPSFLREGVIVESVPNCTLWVGSKRRRISGRHGLAKAAGPEHSCGRPTYM
jgi:hypothetical protein